MSFQTNVNENPRDSQPYVPPNQAQTLTNNPSENRVKQSGGGMSSSGSTVILNSDTLIQSTADSGGIPGARTSLADNASDAARFARSGAPQLPTPDLDVAAPDFSSLAMSGLDSLVRSYNTLSGVLSNEAPADNAAVPSAGQDDGTTDVIGAVMGMLTGAQTALNNAAAATTSSAPQTSSAATSSTTNTGAQVVPLTQAQLTSVSQLASSDPSTVAQYLGTFTLTPTQVNTLADAIARANSRNGGLEALRSSDLAVVIEALANILGVDPSEISGLGSAAEAIQSLNVQVKSNMLSTDPVVVGRVLSAQVDTSKLTAPEKGIVQSYLTLLAQALAFMAEIQCTITQLEGKIKMAYMDAKSKTAEEATSLAIKTASSNTKAIQDNADAKIAQIEASKKAALWKWLGPTITALVAIVAVVAIVATAGAATAPAIAGVSAAVAATTVSATTIALVVVTLLMSLVTILDQTTNFTDKLADALNVPKDSATRQAFKAAFHMVIAIMMIVLTAGVAAPAVTASVAAEEAASTTATTTAMVTSQATIKTLSSLNTMMLMTVLQPLFTSGLVTTGFSELYLLDKKPPNAAQQRDAMIFSTCMTIVAMIVVTAGVGKMSAAAEQNSADFAARQAAANAAAESASSSSATAGVSAGSRPNEGLSLVEESAADHADEAAGAASGAAGAASGASASAAPGVVNEAEQAAKSMTQRFLDSVQNNIIQQFQKEIHYLEQLLKLIQGATNAAAQFQTYQAQTAQAEANDTQAALQREVGQLNAALNFLTSQLPNFDNTVNSFDKDIQKFAEFVTDFAQQVMSFISAAQRASTQLRNSV